MAPFDLLFLVLTFSAATSLLAAACWATDGQRDRARRITLRVLTWAAIYIVVVASVSLVLPRGVLGPGEPLCFDDWCISVVRCGRTPLGAEVRYSVDLRLSSRARRVPQRETNVAVYLTDTRGWRYDPVAGSGLPRFDVLLQPGEAVITRRTFTLPGGTAVAGLAVTHEGGFPIGWLIIGSPAWFRDPPVLGLP